MNLPVLPKDDILDRIDAYRQREKPSWELEAILDYAHGEIKDLRMQKRLLLGSSYPTDAPLVDPSCPVCCPSSPDARIETTCESHVNSCCECRSPGEIYDCDCPMHGQAE